MLIDGLVLEAQQVLAEQGWCVSRKTAELYGEGEGLLAESEAALLLVLADDSWARLEGRMRLGQAALARFVGERDQSNRRWDLFVIGLLPTRPDEDGCRDVDQLEDDTLMARKMVFWPERGSQGRGAGPTSIGPAPWARLFAPLKLAPVKLVEDPLSLMEGHLLRRGVELDVARDSIASFRMTGDIAVP